jgi:hypothetical protein
MGVVLMQSLWVIPLFNLLYYSSAISSSAPATIQVSPKGTKSRLEFFPTTTPVLPSRNLTLKPKKLPPIVSQASLLSPPVSFSHALCQPPVQSVSGAPILSFMRELNVSAAGCPLPSIDENADREKTKQESEARAKAEAALLQERIDEWARGFMIGWKCDLQSYTTEIISRIKTKHNTQDSAIVRQKIRDAINSNFEKLLKDIFEGQVDVGLIGQTTQRYRLYPLPYQEGNQDNKNSYSPMFDLNQYIESLQTDPPSNDTSACNCGCLKMISFFACAVCQAKD